MNDELPSCEAQRDDDFEQRETYKAQSQALGKAGWDDPAMDIYNDYDAKAAFDLS